MKALIICLFLIVTTSLFAQDEIHYFTSFDGTRIAYTDEGKGQPVVLIHGFISSGSSWNGTAIKQDLINTGYRVIIPDLRGNGNSDKPQNAEAYKDDVEVKDLKELAKHLNLNTYYAIGYSRGSIVLAKLLTEDSKIAKAVLGGMGLDFTNPNWPRRIMFADAFSGRKKLTEETEGAIEYAKSIGANLKILGYLQDYQPVTSIAALNKVEIPVLVISGDLDHDNGSAMELNNELSKGKLTIISGDQNNASKGKEFATEVLRFLKN